MEELNELFYREPYTKEFDAQVIRCIKVDAHYETVLSDTAFYPEGGGQPADTGTIDGIAVYDVRRKEDGIVHCTEKEIACGQTVHGVIDWQKRFDHMQSHTGEHLVSGLVHRRYGFDNVGFHMGETIQIDFDGMLTFEQLREIENEANAIIWKNEPIVITYPSKEELTQLDYRSKKELTGKVRIVSIPDGDVCACCGTHTAKTGEIGLIRILSCEKHKNGVRVQMLAGRNALVYDQKVYDQDHIISGLLSAKILETSEADKGLQQQIMDQKFKLGSLTKELLAYKMNGYADGLPLIVDFEEDVERDAMRALAVDLVEKKNARVAAVLSQNGEMNGYVMISHTVNLKDYTRILNESLHGQGGGTSDILQGNFHSCREDITGVLKQMFEDMER